jgi:hypothetical protein
MFPDLLAAFSPLGVGVGTRGGNRKQHLVAVRVTVVGGQKKKKKIRLENRDNQENK